MAPLMREATRQQGCHGATGRSRLIREVTAYQGGHGVAASPRGTMEVTSLGSCLGGRGKEHDSAFIADVDGKKKNILGISSKNVFFSFHICMFLFK